MIKVPLLLSQCRDCGALVGDPQLHSRSHTIPCKFIVCKIMIQVPERKKRARVSKKNTESNITTY